MLQWYTGGPNVGEGIVAYKDGIRLGDNTQGNSYQGDVNYDSGEIMIGRLFKEPGIGQFGKCEEWMKLFNLEQRARIVQNSKDISDGCTLWSVSNRPTSIKVWHEIAE